MTRYLKITQVDGTRYILRVTHESPRFLSGVEVDSEGDEVVPHGANAAGVRYTERMRLVQRDLIKKAIPMRMSPTYARLEAVPKRGSLKASGHASMRKTSKQLDAEIAEALSTSAQRRLKSRLTPVEGLRIPADARRALNTFWRKHPSLRKGCLDKYGFDPIEEEAEYWRYGLAEPDHRDVLRDVRRNHDVFSLPLVRRWQASELRDA